MSIFTKATKQVSETTLPVFRINTGFESLGAQIRPKDNRTPAQLLATINYFLQKNPALEKFKAEIETMNPAHLNLVSDTLELASQRELLTPDVVIDMNKVYPQLGKSILEYLLSVYPKASKNNPESIELAKEVINNTDSLTSKYYLANTIGFFESKEFGQHFKAIKPLIKDFAEIALEGGFLGTFEKQQNFVGLMRGILTPKADPRKIELLPKIADIAETNPNRTYKIVMNKFTDSDTPIKQIEENMEVLPNVVKNSKTDIDIVDFLNKNVNLK